MSLLTTDASLTSAGDFEVLTGLTSAKGLAAIPDGARVALIQALSQNVRWKDDGNDATAAEGMQLQAGKEMWYTGPLDALSFFQEAATATLNILYYQ